MLEALLAWADGSWKHFASLRWAQACGGFVEWPLLEDLEMVQRLGKVRCGDCGSLSDSIQEL